MTDLPNPGDGRAGDSAPADDPAPERHVYDPADGPGNDALEGWTTDDPWRPYTSEEARRKYFSDEATRKRRGGRPKKDPAKKRSAQLHVLLTPAERERVREWAASTSLSVSDYARRRIFGKPIAPRVDFGAMAELSRIRSQLVQLAKLAHQTGEVEHAGELRAVSEQVSQAIRALKLPAPQPPEIPDYPFQRIDVGE